MPNSLEGHAAIEVNGSGNGPYDEAPEPQQSLFSWAEFMAEEPVKPKGRGGKTQAPSLPLLVNVYAAPFCCPLSDGLLILFLCLPYSCFRQITFGRGRRWKPRRRDSP